MRLDSFLVSVIELTAQFWLKFDSHRPNGRRKLSMTSQRLCRAFRNDISADALHQRRLFLRRELGKFPYQRGVIVLTAQFMLKFDSDHPNVRRKLSMTLQGSSQAQNIISKFEKRPREWCNGTVACSTCNPQDRKFESR